MRPGPRGTERRFRMNCEGDILGSIGMHSGQLEKIMSSTKFLLLAILLTGMGTAGAQQGSDPRVADLVRAGKVRIGLFSTQFSKDTATGELRGVRPDMARALAARIGVQLVLLEHQGPPQSMTQYLGPCLKPLPDAEKARECWQGAPTPRRWRLFSRNLWTTVGSG